MEGILLIGLIGVIIYLYLHSQKKYNYSEDKDNSVKKASDNYVGLVEIKTSIPENLDSEKSDDDNYNDNYWIPVESKRREAIGNLRLTYKNTRSIVSKRDFDLKSFSRGDKGFHIHGYCHNKNRNITLSSLGILEAIDISTGEIINNLHEFIEALYKNSPTYNEDMLFEEYGWGIYILIYLSAVSGSVVKKEREIILDFIKSFPKYANIDETKMEKTLRDLYRPGKMEIRNWIKKDIERGIDVKSIVNWIDKLTSVQTSPNSEFNILKEYILLQTQENTKSLA